MKATGVTSQEKFKIRHSTLIEHYQFIEFHLEGIYAAICGEGFSAGMQAVETDSIHRLLSRIRIIEKEKQISVLTEADYEKLDHICTKRNFWCHDCYVYMIFDGKTSAPKDWKPITDDLFEAENVRESLYQLKLNIMDKYADNRQTFSYASVVRRADG